MLVKDIIENVIYEKRISKEVMLFRKFLLEKYKANDTVRLKCKEFGDFTGCGKWYLVEENTINLTAEEILTFVLEIIPYMRYNEKAGTYEMEEIVPAMTVIIEEWE